MYKKASRLKLKFQSEKGQLTVEQLWSLTEAELDAIAVALDAQVEAGGKKSFLSKRSAEDTITKLKFDIVIDVLNTKVEEAAAALSAKEIKEFNNEIDQLILEKEKEARKGLSVEELKQLRK